ncbi:hypothetical protein [Segeticoccus rhizosphaerae]|jgi:hypothetical protein|uniref:hypothetical protein n=1 Tax=Segeticoccus rhizosphaerae TaxID=1104777 RepID=UPI0010BF83E2|nr:MULTISPECIES: hypothetical protein [Intrasporangiaceae]
MDQVWPAIITLIPSVGILYLFWYIMKHILEGDRRERLAHAQWEAEQDRLHSSEGGNSTNSQ